MIQEYQSKDIDRVRWDYLVSSDPMSKVYSMSWFLDAVTDNNWRALILNDYEAVMPFVVKRKWGVQYCYMPVVAQQFLITNSNVLASDFISLLKEKYAYAHIAFSGVVELKNAAVIKRNNFELNLNKTYDELFGLYSKNHKKNLKRFKKSEVEIMESNDISELVTIFKEEKEKDIRSRDMDAFVKNITSLFEQSILHCKRKLYYVKLNNQIIAGAFFIMINNRIYYLLGAAKKEERQHVSALYGLLDHVIKAFSEREMVLDFEGSQIDSIAYFFKGFGSVNKPYSMIEWNELPFFIRWIKR